MRHAKGGATTTVIWLFEPQDRVDQLFLKTKAEL